MPVTVSEVASYWRECEQGKYEPRSFIDRDRYVRWFEADHGTTEVEKVTPATVIRWIRQHPRWKSANTRRGVAQLLHHVFQLATRHRLIPSNPISYVTSEFESGPSRRAVTRAEMQACMKASDHALQRILWCLWTTGLRPGEAEMCLIRATVFVKGLCVMSTYWHSSQCPMS